MLRLGVAVLVVSLVGCGQAEAPVSEPTGGDVVAFAAQVPTAAPSEPAQVARPVPTRSPGMPPPPTMSGPHGYRCDDVVAGEPVIRTVTQPRQVPARPGLRHVRAQQPIAPRRPDQTFCIAATLTGDPPPSRTTAELFSGSLRLMMMNSPTGRSLRRVPGQFSLDYIGPTCSGVEGDIEIHQEVQIDAAADAYTVTLWSVSADGRRQISSLRRGEVSEWGQQGNYGMLCAPRRNLWANAVRRDSELLADDILFAHPEIRDRRP